jgi:hypothetical protein
MKKIKSISMLVKLPVLASLFITLFGFTANMGGDSFKIYVGGKMMFEQHVAMKTATKSLYLGKSDMNETVEIFYSHCGTAGTGRHIAIKDGQGRVVKTLSFPDAAGANAAMSCKVKDIVSQNSNTISLHYSSKELPEGRLLASVLVKNDAKTTR